MEFLELKPYQVPTVRTRQKVGVSTISSGTMKRFLRYKKALMCCQKTWYFSTKSVLGVCDTEKKWYLNILGDFVDNDN